MTKFSCNEAMIRTELSKIGEEYIILSAEATPSIDELLRKTTFNNWNLEHFTRFRAGILLDLWRSWKLEL